QAVSGVLGRAGDPDVALIAIDPHTGAVRALIAIDPHTGAVRAMIGGKDFARAPFNLAVQAKRQPGSAFKPFALAAAIEGGISPGARRTGVSPLEMASAYGTLANDGVHMPPHGIAFAKDASGNVLSDERALRGTPAMDAGIAYEVTSVLQDVARYGTGANAWI